VPLFPGQWLGLTPLFLFSFARTNSSTYSFSKFDYLTFPPASAENLAPAAASNPSRKDLLLPLLPSLIFEVPDVIFFFVCAQLFPITPQISFFSAPFQHPWLFPIFIFSYFIAPFLANQAAPRCPVREQHGFFFGSPDAVV